MDQIIELHEKMSELYSKQWHENVVFTFNWWLLIALCIIPWIIWWLLADKKRLLQIVLIGSFISIFAVISDEFGVENTLWIYPFRTVPSEMRLNPVNLSVLPVLYMLMYQYIKKWANYIIVLVLFSVVSAFVAEPFFVYLDIYRVLSWRYLYSFPIYILLGVVVKYLVDRIERLTKA